MEKIVLWVSRLRVDSYFPPKIGEHAKYTRRVFSRSRAMRVFCPMFYFSPKFSRISSRANFNNKYCEFSKQLFRINLLFMIM